MVAEGMKMYHQKLQRKIPKRISALNEVNSGLSTKLELEVLSTLQLVAFFEVIESDAFGLPNHIHNDVIENTTLDDVDCVQECYQKGRRFYAKHVSPKLSTRITGKTEKDGKRRRREVRERVGLMLALTRKMEALNG